MGLISQDMRFSYEPWQNPAMLRSFLPGLQSANMGPRKSSRLIGRFHEKLVAHLTRGRTIRGRSSSECDVRLPTTQVFEVKAGHCRLQGRKNWTFGPRQLENMQGMDNTDKFFTAFFCYGLGAYNPEELSRLHGRNFIQYAESMFVILMKYSECLNLYQNNLMSLSQSTQGDRRVLLFRHVLALIHQKIQQDENIYANIDLPDAPTLGLIGPNTRTRARNIIIGVDVNPIELIPGLEGDAWRKRFGCDPVPVI